MSEEKFLLKQNAYITFMLNYAPILISGTIIFLFLKTFVNIPDWLEYGIYMLLFISAIIVGICPLKKNNRLLIVSDKSIRLCKFHKKQPQVITQYSNDIIEGIKDLSEGMYELKIKNAEPSVLSLTYIAKPDKELCLKVNTALYKIFKDKFETGDKQEVIQFIETGIVPTSIKEYDKSLHSKRIIWAVINTIVGLLPTLLGILALCWCILNIITVILKLVMTVMS